MAEAAIITRVFDSLQGVDAQAWNALLACQSQPTPFMRHAYLAALQDSGSATPATGWTARFFTLWQGDTLIAACPLYLKEHSYGEYVFDWAWARAYAEHGLHYYPKAVVAVPFTPVPGTRLMARDAPARAALVQALRAWCEEASVSSLHVLFASDEDMAACASAGLMLRHTVQFHWNNAPYADFDGFLGSLNQEKRKKIRQERRRVAEAGVTFRWARGHDIAPSDWDFFYRCYERTYLEHGNPPYLTRNFFAQMESDMPEHWVLFIAERQGRPIASSLIAVSADPIRARGQKDQNFYPLTAYGRYWGALERVDCLHFEACYYQPLEWCIAHGVQRFEGGAQGEHKMARALLPVQAHSAHWLAHPAFADAVDRFLEREGEGVAQYLDELQSRSPFRQP
ncbi:GNAT family N-acetyltransferase [Simplicispira psychrophila]|uniref:GNAT family N-acetyltransferase n=1 Tax=Simplicispira psychrophila TaxID=80882 RepID=UPI000487E45A|nr:GNAT family N-acetyltransferase [Simplicispira psychrophila]